METLDPPARQLYLMDLASNKYEKVSNLPIGQIYSFKFHPSREELAMVLNTTETPGDVYSLNLNTRKTKRWTTSEVGGLNTSLFPKPEFINYETYDEVNGKKRLIPAFIYKPKNGKGPLPVMISIHGGPEGQHTPYFSSFYAYLANEMGIAHWKISVGYGILRNTSPEGTSPRTSARMPTIQRIVQNTQRLYALQHARAPSRLISA